MLESAKQVTHLAVSVITKSKKKTEENWVFINNLRGFSTFFAICETYSKVFDLA